MHVCTLDALIVNTELIRIRMKVWRFRDLLVKGILWETPGGHHFARTLGSVPIRCSS